MRHAAARHACNIAARQATWIKLSILFVSSAHVLNICERYGPGTQAYVEIWIDLVEMTPTYDIFVLPSGSVSHVLPRRAVVRILGAAVQRR